MRDASSCVGKQPSAPEVNVTFARGRTDPYYFDLYAGQYADPRGIPLWSSKEFRCNGLRVKVTQRASPVRGQSERCSCPRALHRPGYKQFPCMYDIKLRYEWWEKAGRWGSMSERSFAPSQKPRNPQALPCCGFRRFRLLSRRRSTASLAACLQMFLVLVGPGHHQLVTANHLAP